jgi:type IV pilus assembly protein PilM
MRSVIGLDIGSKNIKLANLALKGKQIELLRLETIKAPKTSNQQEVIDLLKNVFRKNKIKSNTAVCLSISADESFFKTIAVVSKRKKKLKEAIKNELKKNVVFSLEDCVWDYSVLQHKSKQESTEVLLVAAKKDAIFERTQLVKHSSGFPCLINLDILASYNCFKFNSDSLAGKLCALVDISSTKTLVFIFDERENFWMRTLPFGASQFTNSIVKKLGLSQEESEEYMANALVQESSDIQLKEVLAPVAKELAQELDKAFNYYYFQSSESAAKGASHRIDEMLLCGGGSLCPGLDNLLASTLNIPAKYIYPINKISVKDKSALSNKSLMNALLPQYAAAIGLALQGLNTAAIKINLIKKTEGGLFKRIKFGYINSFLILLCSVLLIFLTLRIIDLSRKTKGMISKSKELNKIAEEYMPKLISLKETYDKTNYKISKLGSMIDKRDIIGRILHKISGVIPEDAWLLNFMLKIDYEKNLGELTISGKCASYASINKLISGLKDAGYFKDIKPVSSRVVIDDATKEELVDFVIKLDIGL